MDGPDLGYWKRWVAYFDWLGFADLVQKEHLQYVLLLYQDVLKLVIEDLKKEGRSSWPINVHRKWASDTFLFYTDDDSEGDFAAVEGFSRIFFCRATMRQIPLRGSLTIGSFHANEDDAIFLGPALVDAYKYAENQDWLGFVLTPNARVHLRCLEAERSFPLETYESYYYAKYNIPYKHDKLPGMTNRLLAYKLTEFNKNIDVTSVNDYYLWPNLVQMCHSAPEKAKIKYENNKKFMLDTCVQLRQLVNQGRA